MTPTLENLGWTGHFAAQVGPEEDRYLPGRVAFESRGIYHVLSEAGSLLCELKGILRKGVKDRSVYPVVGDWVLMEAPNAKPGQSLEGGRGLIVRQLIRRNAITRRELARGEGERKAGKEQVLAANVDLALLVTSLNEDFNIRRLERYLALALDSGAEPVFLLTKTDLVPDKGEEALELVKGLRKDAKVLLLCAPKKQGVKELRALLAPGVSAVLLGSSGVGKSTLVNALTGDDTMAVAEIREADGRGRHTTVGRHLLQLASGACLIDSPGLRDLGLTEDTKIQDAFDDIAQLAAACRFSDCKHGNEPGCAVRAAMEAGTLAADRYDNFQTLLAEQAAAIKRSTLGGERFQREKGRVISKAVKQFYKIRNSSKGRG